MPEEAGRNRLQNGEDRTRAQTQSGEHSPEVMCFPMKVAKENEIKYNEEKGKKSKEKRWVESRIKTDLCGYVRYAGGMKTESSLCECMVNFCIQKIIHIEGTQS